MAEEGILDRDLKSLISENAKELSSIEGNLLSASSGKEIKTILVTSSNILEGKTVTSISMAYSLAVSTNVRVLLIEGNFQSPKIHEMFGVMPSPGLSDLLLSKSDYYAVVKKTEYSNLMIITLGSGSVKKIDAFDTEIFKEKLNILKKDFNYIIVDGSAVFGSSDPTYIAKSFDGVIFVVECEKTKWEVLQEAKDKVSKAGGNVIGVVLNRRIYYIPKILYAKA